MFMMNSVQEKVPWVAQKVQFYVVAVTAAVLLLSWVTRKPERSESSPPPTHYPTSPVPTFSAP